MSQVAQIVTVSLSDYITARRVSSFHNIHDTHDTVLANQELGTGKALSTHLVMPVYVPVPHVALVRNGSILPYQLDGIHVHECAIHSHVSHVSDYKSLHKHDKCMLRQKFHAYKCMYINLYPQRPLPWEVSCLEGPHIPGNRSIFQWHWTCHQRLPVSNSTLYG